MTRKIKDVNGVPIYETSVTIPKGRIGVFDPKTGKILDPVGKPVKGFDPTKPITRPPTRRDPVTGLPIVPDPALYPKVKDL